MWNIAIICFAAMELVLCCHGFYDLIITLSKKTLDVYPSYNSTEWAKDF